MYWVPRFHNIVCSESTKLYTHETCQLIETKVSSRDSDTTADYWLPLVCLNEYIYIYIGSQTRLEHIWHKQRRLALVNVYIRVKVVIGRFGL